MHKGQCKMINEEWAAIKAAAPIATKDERKNKLETLLWRKMLKKDDRLTLHAVATAFQTKRMQKVAGFLKQPQ